MGLSRDTGSYPLRQRREYNLSKLCVESSYMIYQQSINIFFKLVYLPLIFMNEAVMWKSLANKKKSIVQFLTASNRFKNMNNTTINMSHGLNA